MAHYAPFHVTIANVTGPLFEGEASLLTVPSVDGVTTVLAHHEPLIALLKPGVITLTDTNEKSHEFTIVRGVLEVSHNKAIVLI